MAKKYAKGSLFRLMFLIAAVGAGSLPATGPAAAQGVERIGDFTDWSAYRFTEAGNLACYMASRPKTAVGNYSKRGDTYAIVAHRPSEKRRDEVSIVAGYSYKKDGDVEARIGDQVFALFTQDDGAWTRDTEADKTLVAAMIRGRTMVVKGTSSRGTLTTDTYSLAGFSKAHRAIDKACGY